MTTSWHPHPSVLTEYATGRPTAATAASVEAHLITCATCRGRVAPMAPTSVVDAGRARLEVALHRRRRPFAVRVAERLGLSDTDATLLSGSSAMKDSWLLSMILVLFFASMANSFRDGIGDAAFIIVAPLVPVIGVALVYAGTEPTIERIAGAAPYSQLRLLLLRATAVLVTTIPFVLVAAVTVHGTGFAMVAWLLPSLAFTVLVLALSTWFAVELVTPAVVLTWSMVVGGAAMRHHADLVVSGTVQPFYLVLAVLAAVVVAAQVRRGHSPGGVA